jgi:hypothetical protein
LSKDAKWRSFPRVPNLLQYVSNGSYYRRIKLDGKLIRESLKTDVWTTAKLRLTDFIEEPHEVRSRVAPPTFSEAVGLLKRELESDTGIKPQTKKYRPWCFGKLQKRWPDLWEQQIDEITPQECKEWAAKLNGAIYCQYYTNAVGTLK